MNPKDEPRLDDLISEKEREHLLSELHRFLVWVGEQLPEMIEIDGKKIELHDLIMRCFHNKRFSDEERKHIKELVDLLEKKEKYDEETLARAKLTRQEAMRLYHESASLLRALMDIRECEDGKVKLDVSRDEMKQKIDDAKRWLGFLKGVGKKD